MASRKREGKAREGKGVLPVHDEGGEVVSAALSALTKVAAVSPRPLQGSHLCQHHLTPTSQHTSSLAISCNQSILACKRGRPSSGRVMVDFRALEGLDWS